MAINRVAVFCGSSPGNNPIFIQEARNLGEVLAQHTIGVVYGGASIGIMGALADSAIAHGGEVIGVIPKGLMKREVEHNGISKLLVVEDMHTRKNLMAGLSDAFITLPGGFGTFEELLEMITWNQLNIHQKPIFILNVDGFYDPFHDFVEKTIAHGFIRETNRNLYQMVSNIPELLEKIIRF